MKKASYEQLKRSLFGARSGIIEDTYGCYDGRIGLLTVINIDGLSVGPGLVDPYSIIGSRCDQSPSIRGICRLCLSGRVYPFVSYGASMKSIGVSDGRAGRPLSRWRGIVDSIISQLFMMRVSSAMRNSGRHMSIRTQARGGCWSMPSSSSAIYLGDAFLGYDKWFRDCAYPSYSLLY